MEGGGRREIAVQGVTNDEILLLDQGRTATHYIPDILLLWGF